MILQNRFVVATVGYVPRNFYGFAKLGICCQALTCVDDSPDIWPL